MYTVIGVYPDGREANLEYKTLDEALQKLRDLVEADEMEVQCDNAQEVMFLRYAIEVPAIKPPRIAPNGLSQVPQMPPAPMRLRLADEFEDEDGDDLR